MRRSQTATGIVLGCLLLLACPTIRTAGAGGGRLELIVVDRATGEPIPCRIHLKSANGRPRKVKRACFWHDHFVLDGRIMLKLPKGNYAFELERGPEYVTRSGRFTIHDFADDSQQVDLLRFVDMSAEGWWSGDLDVRRPLRDIQRLMMAEDLHVVPLLTWWNDKTDLAGKRPPKERLVRFDSDRYYHVTAGGHVRPGGTLLFFNLPASNLPGPLRTAWSKGEYPPPLQAIRQARELPDASSGTAWIDLNKPFWWDLPMLVAAGGIDSIEIAHSHICRGKVIDNEAGGKPRDKMLFPGVQGNARWSQAIYFHLLECGLRIPPSAGSGTGVAPNPLGYNRIYVHVDGEFTYEKWWENFRAGRVTITNGPLMRPSVHGRLPGHVFHAPEGDRLELEIGLTLSTRKPISYLELIKNGKVAHSIRFDEYQKSGRLPPLAFDRSGWFLIRAVTDLPRTYRFAMTGPYYVRIGPEPRISKRSVRFFLDWVDERARQLDAIEDPRQRRAVMQPHLAARDYWRELVEKANAP